MYSVVVHEYSRTIPIQVYMTSTYNRLDSHLVTQENTCNNHTR